MCCATLISSTPAWSVSFLCARIHSRTGCVCRGFFTERDAAIVTRTLLQLVEYCHARGILHRGERRQLPCRARTEERY